MNGWHDVLKEKMKRLEHLEGLVLFSLAVCVSIEKKYKYG